jgi:hypothetical protein
MGRSEKIFKGDPGGATMAEVISGIPELIEQGNKFTFENFAAKSARGYSSAYSDDWLVWAHHVRKIVAKMDESPISDAIARGLDITLLGEGDEAFLRAKNTIVNGLLAAQRVFGEPIPASDRTVSIGHNSPEQKEVLEKIDKLVAAVEKANDFPGDSDDKELVVAELSAGRRLLQAANVRVAAVRETLRPALKWIIEKSAGAMIGKLAGDLLEYLVHLNFWS